jgi:hypothetical protein
MSAFGSSSFAVTPVQIAMIVVILVLVGLTIFFALNRPGAPAMAYGVPTQIISVPAGGNLPVQMNTQTWGDAVPVQMNSSTWADAKPVQMNTSTWADAKPVQMNTSTWR